MTTEASDFLRRRRSHPPKTLRGPAPSRAELADLLTLATRVPDHGKLTPWRLVVLERAALDRLAPLLADYVAAAGGDEARRAFTAMMKMKKIDVAAIEAARRGN